MKYHSFLLLIAAVFAFLAFTGCESPTTVVKSDDANLSELSLSNAIISPAFSVNTTSYTASVDNSVATTSVTAKPEHSGAILSYTPDHNVNLAVGDNVITIGVIAENGVTKKDYTVTVTRASMANNADLASLSLSDVTLSPAFSANVTSYTATAAYELTTTTVAAAAVYGGATVTVNPAGPVALVEGANVITVTVTAENGTTVRNYTVTVTRTPVVDNADLASLSLSGVTLSPAFSANVTSYTAAAAYPVASTAVTATVADPGAVIAVNPVNPINLAVGNNTITVTVTAENGTTVRTYTVLVTRSNLYYSDTFTDAGSTANLVTASYRPLIDDPSVPMYRNVAGAVTWAGGIVTLNTDNRFTIGANNGDATTATTTPGGCFDFSTPTTLRVRFGAAGVGTAIGYFQVFVNNNTTATRNSPMGIPSRIYITPAHTIAAGSVIEITIPPTAGPDSFLCFQVDAEVTSVRIDEISLIK